MSVIVAAEPILAGAAAHHDHRPRNLPGEQPLLRDSAPPADDSARADDGRRPRQEEPDRRQVPPPEPEPELPPGAMFAAAVVAGALPPVPRTREELILRIGSGWAAPEGGTRLRDLIA